MSKRIISSAKSPAAVGPYSQAVASGGFIFFSGQLPLDPDTGEMVTADMEAATERALLNLKALLAEEGLTFHDIVKTTVYLADMDEFAAMNAAYAKYFRGNPPARACLEAARLPKGAMIEIEAIAAVRQEEGGGSAIL